VVTAKTRTWAGSLVHPQTRLLPGVGARLGRFPRVRATILSGLRHVPTRRGRAIAYRRILQPLVQRMDGELVVSAVGDVRAVAYLARETGRAMATTGLWEWNVGQTIRQILGPRDVFVDVGANEGYYTVLGARIVGESGHVYALEPAPGTFEKLERNVRLNGYESRVTALQVAAGGEEGTATLFGPAAGHDVTSSFHRQPDGTTVNATEVEVQPLHAIVRPEHRERLRLVKIDVEGHEDEGLRGLELMLDTGPMPAIVVEIHAMWNENAAPYVLDLCVRRGLRASWIAEDVHGTDAHLAPADRTLLIEDLGDPPDVARFGAGRYALLLEPRLGSGG
jgi:FkbM family methyltransferase